MKKLISLDLLRNLIFPPTARSEYFYVVKMYRGINHSAPFDTPRYNCYAITRGRHRGSLILSSSKDQGERKSWYLNFRRSLLLCIFSQMLSLSAMDHEEDYGNYGLQSCPPPPINTNAWLSYSSVASDSVEYSRSVYSPSLDGQLKMAIKTRQPAEKLIDLIKQGANPTSALKTAIKVTYPRSILLYFQHRAFYDRQAQALKILLMHGAKPTAALLTTAQKRRCDRALPWLIQYGVHPDTLVNLSTQTALMALAMASEADITEQEVIAGMQTIVYHGAQVNKKDILGRTALMLFLLCKAYDKKASIARTLLALGTNPYIRDIDGKSTLDYAENQEHKKLMQEGITQYQCLICMEHENRALKLLPCTNKHLGNFICPDCLTTVKAKDNSCPLCRNQLSQH